MRHSVESLVEDLEMSLECGLAVEIKGRADLPGYCGDRGVLAVKLVFSVPEVMHSRLDKELEKRFYGAPEGRSMTNSVGSWQSAVGRKIQMDY